MNGLTAYYCIHCGHYTISRYDGIKCAKCNGYVVPAGHAIIRDKNKKVEVKIEMEGYEAFKGKLEELTKMTEELNKLTSTSLNKLTSKQNELFSKT